MVQIKPLVLPLEEDEHGVLRMANRVTVDVILYDFLAGLTAEEIALSYPTLALADIHAVLSCYLSHRGELDNLFICSGEAFGRKTPRSITVLAPN